MSSGEVVRGYTTRPNRVAESDRSVNLDRADVAHLRDAARRGRQGARTHWRDATLICVTHDVSETLDFDRVLVIEGGQIVEDDRPGDLAARPSRYRKLLESEDLVRDRMWAGEQWQRIRVEDGHVERVG